MKGCSLGISDFARTRIVPRIFSAHRLTERARHGDRLPGTCFPSPSHKAKRAGRRIGTMLPLSPGYEGSTASKILPLRTPDDIVLLRAAVRTAALEAGLGLVELTKLITASVEIGRNTVIYGLEGEVAIDTIYELPPGVRLTFIDRGPGMEDVHLAMTDGFTTSGAMGLGLGGTSRLVDEFHIVSAPSEGTTVTIAKWKR